jgi:hypothetical protein
MKINLKNVLYGSALIACTAMCCEFIDYYVVGRPVDRANLEEYVRFFYGSEALTSSLCRSTMKPPCTTLRGIEQTWGKVNGEVSIRKIVGETPKTSSILQVYLEVARTKGLSKEVLTLKRDGIVRSVRSW